MHAKYQVAMINIAKVGRYRLRLPEYTRYPELDISNIVMYIVLG